MSDAVERTRGFVKRYWGDADGTDDAFEDLRYMAARNPRGIREGVEAITSVLAEPPGPGVLVHLVAWDANHPVDSGTDAEAAEWLRECAELARRALDAARAADDAPG